MLCIENFWYIYPLPRWIYWRKRKTIFLFSVISCYNTEIAHVLEIFHQPKNIALNGGSCHGGSQTDFVIEVAMSDQSLCGYI